MANIRYITIDEFKKFYNSPTAKVCDIREPSEYRHENIIGAINTPLSTFNLNEINQLAQQYRLIFHCQSGMRTRQNEGRFSGINTDEVFILEGGLNEWKKAGCVIAKNNKTPLPIMRQVQIAAGTLIVLGAILSYLVSSWFVLVSGFVGVGLIIAGLTGFCGMANLLMMLPYNKNNGCNTGCK